MSSYFFLQDKVKNDANARIIDTIERFANDTKQLVYVLDKPLYDVKSTYSYTKSLIILRPKHKVIFFDYGNNSESFNNYIEDILEDIGHISNKYLYTSIIGRPRNWRDSYTKSDFELNEFNNIERVFREARLDDEIKKKNLDLILTLFIGSINDISRINVGTPQTTLDKVKQKIQLFDADQTRFIYQEPKNKRIRIQGLSGTGKTELLLHKLKDLYTGDKASKIFFTCHNKILADNLRKRIPTFFNFLKVEEQIEWEKRLWCTNAWGSANNQNSGMYVYICSFYQIPFYGYSQISKGFSQACQIAIDEINKLRDSSNFRFAFTYVLIDESQDFDENFIKLCELVTEKNVYIAGDIFQSIFDENISATIDPDFLLWKCYRTDPKTLMFAHALGMGLFEDVKLRWLEEKEWKDCGYIVSKNNGKYCLTREPIRRFEDVEENYKSIEIVELNDQEIFIDKTIQIINTIRSENDTVTPDDIGIIFLDHYNYIYNAAAQLELNISKTFDWKSNIAYETKTNIPNTVLISNRNNVKGLEFAFVICITSKITNNLSYRNSLYTMLTRSFIKTYLIIPKLDSGLTDSMINGLNEILEDNQMIINEPSDGEKKLIQTNFKNLLKRKSVYDIEQDTFKNNNIDIKYRSKLHELVNQMDFDDASEETITEFILNNLKFLQKK